MSDMPVNYLDLLRLALPQAVLVITALLVMSLDMLALRSARMVTRSAVTALLGSLGCVAAIVRIALAPSQGNLLHGVLVGNRFADLTQIGILALTIAVLLLFADSSFTRHAGEYVLLILLATAAMLFLVATLDLLVIFISIELLSLSLYILAAFNKESRFSWEAALKYFLFGGMSAAFLLYGFSIFYGIANSTRLPQIAASIHGLTPLLVIAIVTSAAGLGFKVAAVPFHFWAPDVYQAAPTSSAAFIASASKIASFIVFFEIAAGALADAAGGAELKHFVRGWIPVLAVMAALSMLLGNLVAIRQSSVRRLLAYSAVAHAGYMLLAIISRTPESLASLLYYVITYSISTVGVFAVLAVAESHVGSDAMADLAGFSRREPVLSMCLAMFLLSLAGIPPLAGFFGKFYLFTTVLKSTPGSLPLLWLVILAIATSAVSLYYYLRVLKYIYVTPARDGTLLPASLSDSCTFTRIAAILLAIATLVLGSFPSLLLGPTLRALSLSVNF